MIAKEADFADAAWDIGSYLSFADTTEERTVPNLPSNENIVDSVEAFKTIITGYINEIINRDADVNILFDGNNITKDEYVGAGSDMVNRIAKNDVEVIGTKIKWHRGMTDSLGCVQYLTDTIHSTASDPYDTRWSGEHYKTVMGAPMVVDVSANTITTFNAATVAQSLQLVDNHIAGCMDVALDTEVPALHTAAHRPDISEYDIEIVVLYAINIRGELVYAQVTYETNLLDKSFVALIQNKKSVPARIDTSRFKYAYASKGKDVAPLFADIFGDEKANMINYKRTAAKLKKNLSS